MKCISQLELITKGDVVGAKELELDSLSQSSYSEECDRSKYQNSDLKQQSWTSLQFTEAMSVMNKFLKPKFKKCQNCEAKNPSLTRPTFGWLYKVNLFVCIKNLFTGLSTE